MMTEEQAERLLKILDAINSNIYYATCFLVAAIVYNGCLSSV